MCTDTAQSDIGTSCFFTLPGSNSDRPVDFFRILRIAFLSTSPKRSSLTATADCGRRRRGSAASATGLAGSPPFAAFTYETFTPELVARCTASTDVVQRLDVVDRVETMNETFAKVMAFLQNSGNASTAGLRPISIIPQSHQGCDRTATVLRPIFRPNRVRSQ